MKIIRSQKGNIFLTVIFVLVVATVIGLSLISLTVNGITRNVHREDMNQATIMAEDGIKHITLQINQELDQAIKGLDHYTKDELYIHQYKSELDKILNKYKCDGGTSLTFDNDGKKYTVCYDETNKKNSIHSKVLKQTKDAKDTDIYRVAYFKSIGTADDVTETLISGVKIGAVYTNYPRALRYAVSTINGGNLMLNGGISINGNVRADGNIIVSNSAYLPRILSDRRWIESTYPSISGELIGDSASNSKKGRLYVNSTNGRLFVTDSETLRNWKECGINLYKDVYEQNFNEVTNGNCLFDTESVHNITSYLFNKNDPNLYKTNLVEPFDVENMVKIGKETLAKKVIKDESFYSLYTRGDRGDLLFKNSAAILNESYTASEPKWFKLGIQTNDWYEHLVNGQEGKDYFRVTAPLRNNNFVERSKYTLNGNFHFYGSNLLITGLNSKNTFEGNYYFSNKMPNLNLDSDDEEETKGIARASIRIEDGKHTFDGNFYLDKGALSDKAININRGEHTFKGVYFVDGDIEINGLLGSDLQPAILNTDAIFFVNGNVDIDHTLIKTVGDSSLMIFATGDISFNYATSRQNRQEDYFNDQKEKMNLFLYSQNGKIELHGTVSNYQINGGLAAKNVYLTALRGQIELGMFDRKKFPKEDEQEKSESRLIINYNEEIAEAFATKFSKFTELLSNNIYKTYNDLDSYEPIILSRDFQ